MPDVLQPLLHSGIMLATFSAVALNLFFNGYHKPVDMAQDDPKAPRRSPRTMRMFLLMRKVKKSQHEE